MTAIRIEVFQEEHFPDLLRLHREIFHSAAEPHRLRAKYRGQWAGAAHPSFVALLGDELVGFYGLLPQRLRQGGKTFLALQVTDVMVARGHQQHGLHRQLCAAGLHQARSSNVSLVYGFVNELSHRVYQSLGWHTHQLEMFVLQVVTLPIAPLAARTGVLRQFWERAFHRACRPHLGPRETFRNSAAATNLMHVDYAADYLAYRCFSPNHVLDFGSARAWVRGGAQLWVGDLNAPDDDAHDRAVAGLVRLARRLGIRAVVFQTSPAGPLAARLRRRLPARLGFRVMSLALRDHIDPETWDCHFGDLDTF